MNFKWLDYSSVFADKVKRFLDEEAIRMTGIDEGFHDYYNYWVNEESTGRRICLVRNDCFSRYAWIRHRKRCPA